MKDKLGRKIITKFVGLRAETYGYLTDDGSEDEKAKSTEKCVIKRKLKFKNYKNCLEATRLDNKIKYLEKNKTSIHSLEKSNKEFIRNNKSILKSQQRFKSEKKKKNSEEINKMALSSDGDKKMQQLIRKKHMRTSMEEAKI